MNFSILVTTEVITASIPVDSKELTEDLIKQYASQALRASDCKLIESDPSVVSEKINLSKDDRQKPFTTYPLRIFFINYSI